MVHPPQTRHNLVIKRFDPRLDCVSKGRLWISESLTSHDIFCHSAVGGESFDDNVLAETDIKSCCTTDAIATGMLEQHHAHSLADLPSFGFGLITDGSDSANWLMGRNLWELAFVYTFPNLGTL